MKGKEPVICKYCGATNDVTFIHKRVIVNSEITKDLEQALYHCWNCQNPGLVERKKKYG